MHVNLLPEPFRRRLLLRRQACRWGFVTILTFAVCSGFVATRYCFVSSVRQAQAATALRSKDLHALKAKTAQTLEEAKTIEASIALLRESQPDDRTLALLGIAAMSAKNLDGKLHLKSVTTQMAPVTAVKHPALPAAGVAEKKAVTTSPKVRAPSDFTLEGTAADAAAIAAFIETLRGTTVFTKVDLAAISETAGSTGAARQFRIDCKF